MTIYIDAYGEQVEQDKAVYKVVLQGSYFYCPLRKGYIHTVDRKKSTIALSEYFHEKCLTP